MNPRAGTTHLRHASHSTSAVATFVLRRRAPLPPPSHARPFLSSRELEAACGADPADCAAVRRAVTAAGLVVVDEHRASRRMRVAGPATTLHAWSRKLPAALTECVTAVLCGNAPQAFPRSVIVVPTATTVSYTPLQLATIYGMPKADGTGHTIAIIELGGGFAASDLDTYFKGLGLAVPGVTAVGVDGASNVPGQDPQGADVEVLLDIEVAGAIAPKASIVVYFAPNTDAGFLDALSTAANATPTPTAISISWGQSEDQWTATSRQAMDEACADAAAMGVTVTVAAGDNGSSDSDPATGPHVDFPASSPHALGCGGTTLHATNGKETTETVWNDGGNGGATGGGVSDVFALPAWQQNAGVPARSGGGSGRGVPDVAADADPQTGYQVLADGQQLVVGGTSAVAPLWAGLIARIAQLHGAPLGLVQTNLYAGSKPHTASTHLRDITQGSNGVYQAGPGWDPCTGLGVPETATPKAFTTSASHRR